MMIMSEIPAFWLRTSDLRGIKPSNYGDTLKHSVPIYNWYETSIRKGNKSDDERKWNGQSRI